MAKIENDKYYTSKELAEYVVNKTKEIIGEENITEYIEPSAGKGVFLNYLDKSYKAYDILPEDDRIIKQDYLTLDLEYKKGRLIIGNPPYGNKNHLYKTFYKKSIQLGDYISFILPINQYKNISTLYEFDLIYSENLGKREYSNKNIHCCFNIYKRPINGLNKSKSFKLKDVEIQEAIRSANPKRNKIITKNNFDYDIRIMGWGGGIGRTNQIGCEVEYEGQFSKELLIKINNDTYRDKVINLIKNADWMNMYNFTATPNLSHWMIYKYIKEQIPEIK